LSDGHYSDASLISFLDGELPEVEARAAGRHLDRCWPCRARCQELEQAIGQVSLLFAGTDGVAGDSTDRVKKSLFAAIDRSAPASPVHRKATRSMRPMLLFAAALAAGAAVSRFVVWVPDTGSAKPVAKVAVPAAVPVRSAPAVRQTVAVATLPVPESLAELPAEPLVIPPPVDLDEVELEFRSQLHQTGADLRASAIQIGRQGGLVVVQGVVDTSAQEAELREASAAVSHPEAIRVQVRLASAARLPVSGAFEAQSGEAAPSVRNAEPAVLGELASLAGGPGKLTEQGNRAVATVEKMTDAAWVLYRLEKRFPSSERLSAESWRLLAALEKDYRASLVSLAAELRADLAFLGEAPAAGLPCPADSLAPVLAARDVVEWLFAGRRLVQSPVSIREADEKIAAQLKCIQEF
jgi:hypothetical protein